MEKIEIRVERQQGVPVHRHWHALFGVAGGTIGRGGQNKLVLPDEDAGVARVHAMVRLESEGAFIANLCERRSMLLNGFELCSGQELRLPLGAVIVIGPYILRAVAPGTHLPDFPAAELQSGTQLSHSDVVPSADTLIAKPASAEVMGLAGNPSDPFAFLGTALDSRSPGTVPNTVAGPFVTPNPAKAFEQPADKAPTVGPTESSDSTQPEHHPMSRDATDAVPSLKPAAARPLLIPPDFDTFAPRAATAVSAGRTPWGEAAGSDLSGGLAQVAGVREDKLLQALPPLKEVAQRLDNPAHAGIPEALERELELDPLRLFLPQAETSPGVQTGRHGASGDPLGQVFSLPRRSEEVALPRHAEPLKPAAVPASAGGALAQQGLPSVMLADAPAPAETPIYKLTGMVELVPQASSALRSMTQPTQSPWTPPPLATPDLEPPPTSAEVSAPGSATPAESMAAEPVATPPAGLDEQPLMAAFLEGVGLAPDRVQMRLTPEFMRDFGAVLQVAVQGTIDLMAARSEIKHEFRADVTLIASGANNPLKFLPTAEGVILQILGRSFPGFMPPVPAMKEAYRDLQLHQLALMAGIRAAYVEALTRFDPATLEKQLPISDSVIGRWSATRRKAALWDGYRQSYLDIRRHAEDDLMAFSGRTFVQAYEAAVEAAGRRS